MLAESTTQRERAMEWDGTRNAERAKRPESTKPEERPIKGGTRMSLLIGDYTESMITAACDSERELGYRVDTTFLATERCAVCGRIPGHTPDFRGTVMRPYRDAAERRSYLAWFCKPCWEAVERGEVPAAHIRARVKEWCA